jgi:TRAP-type C4-dicarboxylate transport system permease large subunit
VETAPHTLILPFLVADFVLVGLLIAFPALALWLPSVLKV